MHSGRTDLTIAVADDGVSTSPGLVATPGADDASLRARLHRMLRVDPRQTWWQLVIAAVTISYLVSLFVVARPSSGYISLWDGWLSNLASVLVLIPIYLRMRSSTRLRSAWLCMFLGVALYNAGNLLYLWHDQNLVPIPSPAPSDVPYLASYVAWAIGIAMMTQLAFGAAKVSTRLDGAIAGLAIGAVAGMLWFEQVLEVSGRPLQVIVGMSYPLMDLVLLVLLAAGLAPLRYRPSLSTLLLMVGLAWFVLGDIVYLNQVAAGTYVGGTPLDGTWTIGIWLIGLAAWPREDRRLAPRSVAKDVPKGITFVPIFFGVVSVAVLALSLVHHAWKVAPLLALSALCLVVLRMGLTLRDVRQIEQHSYEAARVDELTSLRNRRAFFEDGERRFAERDDDERLGIILIDLDGFKEVNDSLGHACGDELLTIVARRFEARLGRAGTVARIGGDEFACTCDVADVDELVALGHDLAAALRDPVTLDGVSVRVHASIGVAICPEHGTSEAELLRSADVAMYEAKGDHVDLRVYRAERDANSRGRLAMIDDLRAAIEARDLLLHFQPTVDLHTGHVVGVEALVRWRHPELGLLYPEDFVALAERVGLITSMTRLVLELALERLAALDVAGHHLTMSVNVSHLDLADASLPGAIEALLARSGIAPHRLTLEVTESCLGENPTNASASIERLRAAGIRVAVDDFGVGYSSMSQLLELQIDELKIDKSFVLAMRGDDRARAVVQATVDLARALSLTTVAEGIEDAATLRSVRAIGVDVAQGYFIACPFTEAQLDAFLAGPAAVVERATLR